MNPLFRIVAKDVRLRHCCGPGGVHGGMEIVENFAHALFVVVHAKTVHIPLCVSVRSQTGRFRRKLQSIGIGHQSGNRTDIPLLLHRQCGVTGPRHQIEGAVGRRTEVAFG